MDCSGRSKRLGVKYSEGGTLEGTDGEGTKVLEDPYGKDIHDSGT